MILHNMSFPNNGQIITISQLKYYKPRSQSSPDSIISSMIDKQTVDPLTSLSPIVYKYVSLLSAFPGPLPLISNPNSSSVYMLQASWTTCKKYVMLGKQLAPLHYVVAPSTSGATNQEPPPSVGAYPLFPLGTVSLGLNHPRTILPRHYQVDKIPFLFPPPIIFYVPIMATLSLPNIKLGILVWYIYPPANTFPGQLRPYHTFSLVQPVPMIPSFALFLQKPQQDSTPIMKASGRGEPKRRNLGTRLTKHLQFPSLQIQHLCMLCVILLGMPPITILKFLASNPWMMKCFLYLTCLSSKLPYLVQLRKLNCCIQITHVVCAIIMTTIIIVSIILMNF